MIITIARQCGCGAINVGRLLAEHYGIPFYTRKSLLEMARERGVLDEMEAFFDERPVDELLFAMSSYGESHHLLTEKPLRTLADMVGEENCVIIGRCGNYIFRHRKDLVSVFLKGSLDARIANIQAEQNLSAEEAKEFVEHVDDCRVAYHKYYTDLTWGNADDYDICLDCDRLGAEQTAAMIEHYVKEVGSKTE
nr:cytidylate kinase-like family protein [Prevotella sp.]